MTPRDQTMARWRVRQDVEAQQAAMDAFRDRSVFHSRFRSKFGDHSALVELGVWRGVLPSVPAGSSPIYCYDTQQRIIPCPAGLPFHPKMPVNRHLRYPHEFYLIERNSQAEDPRGEGLKEKLLAQYEKLVAGLWARFGVDLVVFQGCRHLQLEPTLSSIGGGPQEAGWFGEALLTLGCINYGEVRSIIPC